MNEYRSTLHDLCEVALAALDSIESQCFEAFEDSHPELSSREKWASYRDSRLGTDMLDLLEQAQTLVRSLGYHVENDRICFDIIEQGDTLENAYRNAQTRIIEKHPARNVRYLVTLDTLLELPLALRTLDRTDLDYIELRRERALDAADASETFAESVHAWHPGEAIAGDDPYLAPYNPDA